jgi:Putative Actinobacterial Holin-X, holin superfamily III
VHSEKSIGTVLAETKEELKNFVQTRLAILKAELSEKIKSWKALIPLAITAALVLVTAFFAVTFTLVALLAGLFQPRPLAWFFGGAIVSLLYLAIGAILGLTAVNRIKAVQMVPTRTLEVLKQDQIWIQKETKAA